jgi:hypothetical protein
MGSVPVGDKACSKHLHETGSGRVASRRTCLELMPGGGLLGDGADEPKIGQTA